MRVAFLRQSVKFEATILYNYLKRYSPQNVNSVINYSPSCCSKPHRKNFVHLRNTNEDIFDEIWQLFLGLEHGSFVAVYAGLESSWIYILIFISYILILIFVPKRNECIKGLEWHEGE